jgi:hypothetical protein
MSGEAFETSVAFTSNKIIEAVEAAAALTDATPKHSAKIAAPPQIPPTSPMPQWLPARTCRATALATRQF